MMGHWIDPCCGPIQLYLVPASAPSNSRDVGDRARCSSMVECPLMARWVIGLIPVGGPIELYLIPTSAPYNQITVNKMC